jgi:hypothetical protein
MVTQAFPGFPARAGPRDPLLPRSLIRPSYATWCNNQIVGWAKASHPTRSQRFQWPSRGPPEYGFQGRARASDLSPLDARQAQGRPYSGGPPARPRLPQHKPYGLPGPPYENRAEQDWEAPPILCSSIVPPGLSNNAIPESHGWLPIARVTCGMRRPEGRKPRRPTG